MAPGEAPNVYTTVATNGYFETMGVALRRGRPFAAADNATGAKVALVSESFVQRYFRDEDPIGQRIAVLFDGGQSREIVGVVADVRHDGLQAAPRDEMYMPHAQFPFGSISIVVRMAGTRDILVPAMGDGVRLAVAGVAVGLVAFHESIQSRPCEGSDRSHVGCPGDRRASGGCAGKMCRLKRPPGSAP